MIKNKPKLSNVFITFFIFCAVISMGAVWYDNDFYHILNAGRDVFKYGPPHYNYSTMFNLKVVTQQWLYDAGVAFMYDHFGYIGCLTVTIFFSIVTYFLVYKLIKISLNITIDKRILALAALIVEFVFTHTSIRPEWITTDLIFIQLIICQMYVNKSNWKYLLFLPLIILVEINVHASYWIFHFVMLLPYIADIIINRLFANKFKIISNNFNQHNMKLKHFIIPTILMTGSLFINPYGVDGIMYLFNSLKVMKNTSIDELENAGLAGLTLSLIVPIILLLVFFFVNSKIKSKINIYQLCITLGCIILGSTNSKNIAFTIFVFLELVIWFTNLDLLNKIKITDKNKNDTKIKVAIYTLLIINSLIFLSSFNTGLNKYNENFTKNTNVANAITCDKDEPVFCTINEAGWLQTLGFTSTFIDPRPELNSKLMNGEYDILADEDLLINKVDYSEEHFLDLNDFNNLIEKYDFQALVVDRTILDNLSVYMQTRDDYTSTEVGDFIIFNKKK